MHFVPRLVAGFLVSSLAVGTGIAIASAPMVGKAKSAGMPVKNCQYCHTEALPKKETFKPEELNERGKWLLADMKTRIGAPSAITSGIVKLWNQPIMRT